ncbi:unnamed protein product [Phytomonas sp. Hart1]|nr:unnamed protein product [Phytomonas sp. Hart1]|eukprot:CCW71987.1 unnamed protein product [Phytomonas sp. isolate Hart1]
MGTDEIKAFLNLISCTLELYFGRPQRSLKNRRSTCVGDACDDWRIGDGGGGLRGVLYRRDPLPHEVNKYLGSGMYEPLVLSEHDAFGN